MLIEMPVTMCLQIWQRDFLHGILPTRGPGAERSWDEVSNRRRLGGWRKANKGGWVKALGSWGSALKDEKLTLMDLVRDGIRGWNSNVKGIRSVTVLALYWSRSVLLTLLALRIPSLITRIG